MTLQTKNVRAQKNEKIRENAVHTTDEKTATDVVFYLLSKKFVEEKDDIPKESRDVMYYTLAMGHNTGVIDCFEPKLALKRKTYDAVCEALPEGDAKFKLTRIEKFGEIQIFSEDANDLADVIKNSNLKNCFSNRISETGDVYENIRVVSEYEFKAVFIDLMNKISNTPQVYCLARRVTR